MALHPFERSNLGSAPFRCVGVYSLPSPGLAAQNPEAYQAALRQMPQGYGCGSCAHCGMPLVNNYLIHSSDGRKFSVGCECVAKTGDKALGTEVDRERLALDRAKRAAARQRKWDAYRQSDAFQQQAREREEAERRREEEEAAKRAAVRQMYAFLLPALRGANQTEFIRGIVQQIEEGSLRPGDRLHDILSDIYARSFGRRNTKAYEDALDEYAAKAK